MHQNKNPQWYHFWWWDAADPRDQGVFRTIFVGTLLLSALIVEIVADSAPFDRTKMEAEDALVRERTQITRDALTTGTTITRSLEDLRLTIRRLESNSRPRAVTARAPDPMKSSKTESNR